MPGQLLSVFLNDSRNLNFFLPQAGSHIIDQADLQLAVSWLSVSSVEIQYVLSCTIQDLND